MTTPSSSSWLSIDGIETAARTWNFLKDLFETAEEEEAEFTLPSVNCWAMDCILCISDVEGIVFCALK
jgi:hypothetical protein